MDEEKNNNTAKQVADAGKQIAKDALKEGTKEFRKKIVTAVLPYLGWAVLILLAVGAINLIVYEIKTFFTGKTTTVNANETSETASAQMQSLVTFGENGEYTFDEDYADDLLVELEGKSIDTIDMGYLTSSGENMIDKYLKVELQTMLPKTGEKGDFDGIIKIQRAEAESGKVKDLKYMNYSDFCALTNANDTKALDYFSLNPENFKLCLASNEYTIYKDFDGKEISSMTTGKVTKSEIDYQTSIQSYSAPLNFLLTIHSFAQDEVFMNELIDMIVKDDDPIILTYVESSLIETTQKDYSGFEITYTTTVEVDAEGKELPDTKNIEAESKDIDNSNIRDYEENIDYYQKIQTTNIAYLKVTKADTWLKEIKRKVEVQNYPEAQLEEISSEVIRKGYGNPYVTTEDTTKTTVKKYTSIEEKISSKSQAKGFTVVDTVNKIRVDDFVELIKKYPKVEDNLKSAPSNVFSLLQENENTQKHEKIMRYVIYKLTGISYGVTEADLENLLNDSLVTYKGITNLATYIRQFSHSSSAPKSQDGKYYLMYGDGAGWPTIGDADLQWISNWEKFSVSGKVLQNGEEKEVANIADYVLGYLGSHNAKFSDTEIYKMQIYIEKKVVDEIGSEVVKKFYTHVESATEGINLSRQQMYALSAIAHNFGSLPVRNGKTFKQTYEAASALYEEGSWEHNRYVWDNWWCKLGGGATGHIPARDASYETYVKGVFDFSRSEAGTVFSRKYYIFYTQAQLDYLKDHMWDGETVPKKPLTRTAQNEEELFTTEQPAGVYEPDNSDSKVNGYYTSTTGRRFTILNQLKISNWGDKCNRAAAAIIASGYSEESASELVNKINLDKSQHGWGVIPGNNYFNEYGLKKDKYISANKSVNEYADILREHLQMGGYAMVWINITGDGGGGTYIGKSGTRWTGLYHWVPILDYIVEDGEEKIFIGDWRGGAWYSIYEFQHGLSEILLISEN